MKEESNCIKCEQTAFSRGLCRTHYKLCWKLVRSGETTWHRLVESGHAQASRPERFADWKRDVLK